MILRYGAPFEFSVLLLAMIGNAQIFGIDLALAVIAPVCLFALWIKNPIFSRAGITIGLIVSTIFLGAIIQAVRFDHSLGYGLWPIKAALVGLLASHTPRRISAVHFWLILFFVILLIATSSEIYGRSYGLFGPNMLYRFYGLLFLVSCVVLTAQIVRRPLALAAIGIAIMGIFSTGSTGGLILLGVGALIFFRPSIKIVCVLAVIGIAVVFAWDTISGYPIIRRALLKMSFDNFNAAVRFLGIYEMLQYPFSIGGHEYLVFQSIWMDGYEYPHNIFIELYSFFGMIGLTFVAVILWAVSFVITQVRRIDVSFLGLALIASFIGANLSGDLSDNYGVIGISIGILFRKLDDRKSHPVRPKQTTEAIF